MEVKGGMQCRNLSESRSPEGIQILPREILRNTTQTILAAATITGTTTITLCAEMLKIILE